MGGVFGLSLSDTNPDANGWYTVNKGETFHMWCTGGDLAVVDIESFEVQWRDKTDLPEITSITDGVYNGYELIPQVNFDTNEVLLNKTDYTYTVEAKEGSSLTNGKVIEPGEYTVTVTGKGEYKNQVKSFDWTVVSADLADLDLTAVDTIYTGEDLGAPVIKMGALTVNSSDYTYSLTDSNGTPVDAAVNVDTYTVHLTAVNGGRFTGTKDITWSVKPTAAKVTAAPTPAYELGKSSFTYTGEEYTLINPGTVDAGVIQYAMIPGLNITTGGGQPHFEDIKVGNVYSNGRYRFPMDCTFTDGTNQTASALFTPGQDNFLIITSVDDNTKTVGYKYINKEAAWEQFLENASWSEELPVGTLAGNYSVFYRATGDADHSAAIGGYVNVKIAQADTGFTAPTAAVRNLPYNGEYQALVTSGQVSSELGTISYGLADEKESTLTVNSNGGQDWRFLSSSDVHIGDIFSPSPVRIVSTWGSVHFPTRYNIVINGVDVGIAPDNYGEEARKANLSYNGGNYCVSGGRTYYLPAGYDAVRVTDKNIISEYWDIGTIYAEPVSLEADTIAEWNESVPSAKEPGKYSIYYKLDSKNPNYSSVIPTKIATINIVKANIDYSVPTLSANHWFYNGESRPLVNVGDNSNVQNGTVLYGVTPVTIQERNGTRYTAENPDTIYKPTGGSGIIFPSGYNVIFGDNTIYSNDSVQISLTKNGNVYNMNGANKSNAESGTAFALPEGCDSVKITDVDTENNTITVQAVNAIDTAVTEWTTDVPEAEEVGTYNVYYKVDVDEPEHYNAVPVKKLGTTVIEYETSSLTLGNSLGQVKVVEVNGKKEVEQTPVNGMYVLKATKTYRVYTEKSAVTDVINDYSISAKTVKNDPTYKFVYTIDIDIHPEFDSYVLSHMSNWTGKIFSGDTTKLYIADGEVTQANRILAATLKSNGIYYFGDKIDSSNVEIQEAYKNIVKVNKLYFTDLEGTKVDITTADYGTYVLRAEVLVDNNANGQFNDIDTDLSYTLLNQVVYAPRIMSENKYSCKTEDGDIQLPVKYAKTANISSTNDLRTNKDSTYKYPVVVVPESYWVKDGQISLTEPAEDIESWTKKTPFVYDMEEKMPEITVKNGATNEVLLKGNEEMASSESPSGNAEEQLADYIDGVKAEKYAGLHTYTLVGAAGTEEDPSNYSGSVTVAWSVAKADIGDYIAAEMVYNTDTDGDEANDAIVYDGARLDGDDFNIMTNAAYETLEEGSTKKKLVDEFTGKLGLTGVVSSDKSVFQTRVGSVTKNAGAIYVDELVQEDPEAQPVKFKYTDDKKTKADMNNEFGEYTYAVSTDPKFANYNIILPVDKPATDNEEAVVTNKFALKPMDISKDSWNIVIKGKSANEWTQKDNSGYYIFDGTTKEVSVESVSHEMVGDLTATFNINGTPVSADKKIVNNGVSVSYTNYTSSAADTISALTINNGNDVSISIPTGAVATRIAFTANNTAGNGNIEVDAADSYTGNVSAKRLMNYSSGDYTISAITVEFSYPNAFDLTFDEDYTVAGVTKSTASGTKTVQIKGQGKFTGTATAEWNIDASGYDEAGLTFIGMDKPTETDPFFSKNYDGKAVRPMVTFDDPTSDYALDSEWTVKYYVIPSADTPLDITDFSTFTEFETPSDYSPYGYFAVATITCDGVKDQQVVRVIKINKTALSVSDTGKTKVIPYGNALPVVTQADIDSIVGQADTDKAFMEQLLADGKLKFEKSASDTTKIIIVTTGELTEEEQAYAEKLINNNDNTELCWSYTTKAKSVKDASVVIEFTEPVMITADGVLNPSDIVVKDTSTGKELSLYNSGTGEGD